MGCIFVGGLVFVGFVVWIILSLFWEIWWGGFCECCYLSIVCGGIFWVKGEWNLWDIESGWVWLS